MRLLRVRRPNRHARRDRNNDVLRSGFLPPLRESKGGYAKMSRLLLKRAAPMRFLMGVQESNFSIDERD